MFSNASKHLKYGENTELSRNSTLVHSYRIHTFYHHSDGRHKAEAFIKQQYSHYYQADINDFYPQLLSLHDGSDNSIQAISGLRCARNEKLFSEYYLPQEVERELSLLHNQDILRNEVVEVGNLALTKRSQIRSLIVSLIAYLYAAGFNHMVFTTIPGISNSFKRVGLSLQTLADAKFKSLPTSLQQQWGKKYYQMHPKVYALDVNAAHIQLAPLFQQASSFLRQLWLDGYALGEQHFQKAAVA